MRNKLANIILKDLFNAVTEDEILRQVGGKLIVGGLPLPEESKISLASEALTIKQTNAWKYLIKDMKYLANKGMYDQAQNSEDILFGKAMLYAINVLELKIDKLSKIK